MNCPNTECQQPFPDHVRFCIVCGADVGFPNVRAAQRAEEIAALDDRIKRVFATAAEGGYVSVLAQFEAAVAKSVAVINRPLLKVSELVSSDNALSSTFHQQVEEGSRLPEENRWDQARQAADALLFPYYFREITFGALSLDRKGIDAYGNYSIVLRESAIRARASVFEGNSLLFVQRNSVVAGQSVPAGFRASWGNRARLALAKCASTLTMGTEEKDFPAILVSSMPADPDFIEVHIYGPIHRRGIAAVRGPAPKRPAERAIVDSIRRKLKEVGAGLELF